MIEKLNADLAAARADLDRALADGADTTEARLAIAYLENEIAAYQRAERERRAVEAREEAARVEKAAAELAAQTHGAVDLSVTVKGLAELNIEPVPDLPRDPQIDVFATAVARARVALERAEGEHQPHVDRVENLRRRVAEKLAAIDAITMRRLEGDERAGDAAELELLRADAAALDAHYADAKLAAAAEDRRPAARAELSNAETQLIRAQKRAVFDTCLARVRQVERVFLEAFAGLVRAGREAGVGSPWSAYQPSPDLRRAVTGQLVQGASNPFLR